MFDNTPEAFFGNNRVALDTFRIIESMLRDSHPEVQVRVTKSQVAFRLRRGFAYLWVPGQYLTGHTAPVVLSIALQHRIESTRFKETVHPGPWMHHLEVWGSDEVDEEVRDWLTRAADEADR